MIVAYESGNIVLDDSFTPDNVHNVLSKTKSEEHLLSIIRAEAHKYKLEDCIKFHPSLSWSVLISLLLRAKEKEVAKYVLQNHEFHVKGRYTRNICLLNNLHSMHLQVH